MINLQSKHIESRERKDFSNLVIFTWTSYQDDERSQIRSKLAIKMIENANKYWIKIVMIDRGSGTKFLEQLKTYDNVTIIDPKEWDTMAWDRRNALQKALELYPDAPYFLWTEPEKDDFITPKNLSPVMDEIETGKYAIVVPKRADKSTMVDFQAREETRANKELSALAAWEKRIEEKNPDLYWGEQFDLFFGPKIMTRKGAEYFLKYKGQLDKRDGTITPVLLAKAQWENIWSATVNYEYDSSQIENEHWDKNMNRKRLHQYVEILNETKRQLLISQNKSH